MGYTAYTAANSRDAISIFEKEKDNINLVILDMIMPDMTGDDIFVIIREINPDVKILLSSGYSLNSKAHGIMNLGCNGFIQKPFDRETLSSKIREIIDCAVSCEG